MNDQRENESSADGDAMPGPSLRERARACDPQPMVPLATCVFAGGLWIGCALAQTSGFARVALAEAARPLALALLIVAMAAGMVLVGLGVWMAFGRVKKDELGNKKAAEKKVWSGKVGSVSVDDAAEVHWSKFALLLLLIALCAGTLGAGMRFDQVIEQAMVPIVMTDGGVGGGVGGGIGGAVGGAAYTATAMTEGQLVTVEATVASGFTSIGFGSDILAKYFRKPPKHQCLMRDIEFIGDDGARINMPTGAFLSISVLEQPPPWKVGDRLSIVGKFMPIARSVVPSTIDFTEVAARRGLIGSLVVESENLATMVAQWRSRTPIGDWFARARESLRGRMREALLAGVPGAGGESGIRSMLVALVLGDVEDGYRSIENSFRAVGLSHILAISGFNLAVLGWVVAWMAGLFIRDERWRAAPVAMAALIALWVMAPAASAMRSALMAVLGASGCVLKRDWNGDAILAFAAIAMLLHDPSAALGPGFQLSFLCVIALRKLAPAIRTRWLAWMPADDRRQDHPAWIALSGEYASRAIAAGLAAFFASVPVVLVQFGSLQPFGTLLTFLCTPLSTVTLAIAYPKAIIGAIWPPLTIPVGPILWISAWLQVELVERSITAGGGTVQVGSIASWTGVAMMVLLFAAFLSNARVWRVAAWGAIGVITVSLLSGQHHAQRPRFEITMLAVGDGSAYVVRSGGSTVLFDGGSSSTGSVAARALLPMIGRESSNRIDAIIVSHPNLDHFSALLDVARYARVGELIVHPSFVDAARRMPAVDAFIDGVKGMGVRVREVSAGDSVRIGKMTWTFVWPDANFRSSHDNDLSLVVRATHDSGARALFCGDIETEPAARISASARNNRLNISCDVLELPHHGSWREAVVDYIETAAPSIILQSTARRRFDADRFAPHLSPTTFRFVTCRDGTVRITLGEDGRLHTTAWDSEAMGGWRPMGVSSLRDNDETGAIKLNPVTGDAISAIGDPHLECRGVRSRLPDRNRDTTMISVKNESLTVGRTKREVDLYARVHRRRLGQGDLAREHDRATTLGYRRRKFVTSGQRSREFDQGEPEQRARARTDMAGVGDGVMKTTGRHLDRWLSENRQRKQSRWIKETCDWIGGAVVGRHRWTNAKKQRIGQTESPSFDDVKLEFVTIDDRPVNRPDPCARLSFAGLLCLRVGSVGSPGKRDGCNSIIGKLAPFGTSLPRWRFVRRNWLESDVGAERLDKACGGIAVEKENRVAILTSSWRQRPTEPNRRDLFHGQRNRADPTVIPIVPVERCTKIPRQALAIISFEKSERDRSRGGEVAVGVHSTNRDGALCDEGNDIAARKNALGCTVGFDDRPTVRVNGVKLAGNPSAIGGKNPNQRVTLSMSGLRPSHGNQQQQRSENRLGATTRGISSEPVFAHQALRCLIRHVRETLALEDWEVSLRHLQNDHRHCGRVCVSVLPISPRPIRVLASKELFANRRPPRAPMLATSEIHGLNGVVVTVEIVGLHEVRSRRCAVSRARKRVLLQVIKTAGDGLIFINTRVIKTRDARRCARPLRASLVAHVAKPTVGILALAHITHRLVDGGFGHLHARVASTAKSHDLTDGHRDIRISGNRVVAPAAFIVLASDDQLNSTNERVANAVIVVVHAVNLAEEERGETVTVHRTVSLVGNEQARFTRVGENEVEGLLDAVAEIAASRDIPVGHERYRAEARHSDVFAVPTFAERAIWLLLPAQILKASANRIFESWRDLRIHWCVLRTCICLLTLGGRWVDRVGLGLRRAGVGCFGFNFGWSCGRSDFLWGSGRGLWTRIRGPPTFKQRRLHCERCQHKRGHRRTHRDASSASLR